MAKSKEVSEQKLDPLAWLGTFSDLLTNMLTFFVLLISMSSMDSKALRATFGFFDEALGVLERVASSEVHHESLLPIASVVATQVVAQLPAIRTSAKKQKKSMSWAVERIIDQNNLEGLLEARSIPGGIKLSLLAGAFFEPGTARLRPSAMVVLEAVADLLRDPQLSLTIEGRQSDSDPLSDPLQLAAERSLAVCNYLLGREGVQPERVIVAAYGPGWEEETLDRKQEKLDLVFTWQPAENKE